MSGGYRWSGVEAEVKTWGQMLEQRAVWGGRKGDAKSGWREERLEQKNGISF